MAKSIVVDGVEYVPVEKCDEYPVKIVVLQRGWVFVGHYVVTNESEHRLEKAKCIRVWGTTKGLGELIEGPTSSTKLDESGTVRFHPLTVVCTLDCEAQKWSKHL